ncbi:MAG: Sec-independent protein translocase protein TatB [Lautropia sp.]|nr:Sec-independent protein translocase protein TatB [Lautropia sp.]
MFDISFMEMLIVAIAALVVLGPERLPTVARQAGQWMARMRRYIEDVKSDFGRQMDLAELKNIKAEVEDSARSISRDLQDVGTTFDSSPAPLAHAADGADEDAWAYESPSDADPDAGHAGDPAATRLPPTDWDKVFEDRRTRQRLRDMRIERELARGFKRPRFRMER